MAERIFQIGGVPDQEVDDVRHLLHENKIAFYETPKGNFGLSMAAIWVTNDRDAARARELINQYQANLNQRPPKEVSANINWRLLPWAILLLILLWMMSMGYTR